MLVGWTLIFCGADTTLVNSQTNTIAGLADRVYYAGYTITTIGYGDFRTPGNIGQLASILGGLNGLFLVTLAITYTMPVLSAVVVKRQLALQINCLGEDLATMIEQGRSDGDFSYFASELQQLNSGIAGVSQQYLTYPVLHYFHTSYRPAALPINLARLDEAVTLILTAFPRLPSDVRMRLRGTHAVIHHLLATLDETFIEPTRQPPPAPPLACIEVLRQVDTPRADLVRAIENKAGRSLLLAFVENDGWPWRDVHGAAA